MEFLDCCLRPIQIGDGVAYIDEEGGIHKGEIFDLENDEGIPTATICIGLYSELELECEVDEDAGDEILEWRPCRSVAAFPTPSA